MADPEPFHRVSTATWDGIRYVNAMQLEVLVRDYAARLKDPEAARAVIVIADALGVAVSGVPEGNG